MRASSFAAAWMSCLCLVALVQAQSPQQYEEMGNEAARSGNYVLAAQDYALAAEAYAKLGNHSAAAVNHERAATLYAAIGSTDLYLAEALEAASSYAVAGSGFFDEGNYWYAASAFARSAAFYNATNKPSQYREMQTKAGNAFLLSAASSQNLTGRIRSLYSACLSFYSIDRSRFEDSMNQLEAAVGELKDEAIKAKDASVFDVLEVYYIPIFSQLLGDDLASARKMEEIGRLADQMGYFAYAAGYFTSAAVFYKDSGRQEEATASLRLVGDAYGKELKRNEVWNYTGFMALKDYLEEALYVLRFLNQTAEADEIAKLAVGKLDKLGAELVAVADLHAARSEYEWAASNYSAAAEIFYILGDEKEFKRLNGISGSMGLLQAQLFERAGNATSAAEEYDGAGFLLRLAGNETYKMAYANAARLHASLGNQLILAGNLTLAADHIYMAARDFKLAGDPSSASYYEKYIMLIEELMPSDPQTRGIMFLSIGNAQSATGNLKAAAKSYAQASDELVKVVSSYLSTYPQYLLSVASLPKNLAKAYRLSGSLYLARNLVKTLDYSYMYSTLATLASIAQLYGTAARIHGALAQSDMLVYDFQSYAVNKLFCGIAAMLAGNDLLARSSLKEFELLNHPLHSANRKFYELLTRCLSWKESRNQTELEIAQSIISEVRSVSEDSDMESLLQDLEDFLLAGADPVKATNEALSKASAGNWKAAGEFYYSAGLLRYFREEFNLSLSAFEDSSFMFMKSGNYAEAGVSAARAYECTFQPTNFTLGLRALSQAFLDSNRTLAGMARVNFKQARKKNYKPDKSKELMRMAAELEGINWSALLLQTSIAIIALVCASVALLIIRRRSGK